MSDQGKKDPNAWTSNPFPFGDPVDNLKKGLGMSKAEGGEVEDMEGDDDEAMMDAVAQECMDSIESKDKEGFKSSLHVLVSDILQKLSNEMESGGEE